MAAKQTKEMMTRSLCERSNLLFVFSEVIGDMNEPLSIMRGVRHVHDTATHKHLIMSCCISM